MKGILKTLQPEALFANFEALTNIPRESGNEKAVSDYLVEFAKLNGLEVIQEPSNNVIIKKPGTAGFEKAPTVILQGHMDMVCVKEAGLDFDFEKDAIPLKIDGDMICTEGTTLGADNGIAVAMAMTVLASKELAHPPLVALITVAEETGMDGVLNLIPENISGDILINIDSEEEGVFLSSCAGGVKNRVTLPVRKEVIGQEQKAYTIAIKGLMGGHSGIEINKNRANAIKLLGRLLVELSHLDAHIARVSGGEKMNAIAKMAEVDVVISAKKVEALEEAVRIFAETVQNEYKTADPQIQVTMVSCDIPELVLTDESMDQLTFILRQMPFGVQTMSADIDGLVESSNNIGVLQMQDKTIVMESAVRSSVKSLKAEINGRIQLLCDMTGAKMELIADYPEWEYKVDSPIRDLMVKVYQDMFDVSPKVDAIHAGLECGFLKEKVGDIDMISIGPNMWDVHTPQEKLSISSTQRVYKFLCEVLSNIK